MHYGLWLFLTLVRPRGCGLHGSCLWFASAAEDLSVHVGAADVLLKGYFERTALYVCQAPAEVDVLQSSVRMCPLLLCFAYSMTAMICRVLLSWNTDFCGVSSTIASLDIRACCCCWVTVAGYRCLTAATYCCWIAGRWQRSCTLLC